MTLRLSPAEVDGGAGAVAHQEGTCAGHFFSWLGSEKQLVAGIAYFRMGFEFTEATDDWTLISSTQFVFHWRGRDIAE